MKNVIKHTLITTSLTALTFLTGCSNSGDTNTTTTVENNKFDYNSRIVADYYIGELLALDVNLVGGDLTFTSSAWDGLLDDVVNVSQSLELMASLQPDVIVTMREEMVAQYENIAPTILIPWGTYNPTELITEFGVLLSREEEANNWINTFEENIAHLKEVMPDTSYTFTIADILGGDLVLYGEHFARAGYIIYNRLGFSGTPEAEETYIRIPESYLFLTPEAMPQFIGDFLLMLNEAGTPDGANEITDRFTDTLIWSELPAVQNDRVFFLRSEDFWFADPISLNKQIEILMEIFNER